MEQPSCGFSTGWKIAVVLGLISGGGGHAVGRVRSEMRNAKHKARRAEGKAREAQSESRRLQEAVARLTQRVAALEAGGAAAPTPTPGPK